jgi:hypothetical protein
MGVRFWITLIVLLIGVPSFAGSWDGMVINEIMPANISTVMDMDYVAFSGWIELSNQGDRPIDITSCYLTDDLADPSKWKIPSVPAIWVNPNSDAQALVPSKSIWKYWKGKAAPSANMEWTQANFDDSTWQNGLGGFGYGDTEQVNTLLDDMLGQYSSVFIRQKFTIDNPETLGLLGLRIFFDDSFACFINGKLVAQAYTPDPLSFDALARMDRESTPADFYELGNAKDLLTAGDNIIALVGFNIRIRNSDFVLAPALLHQTGGGNILEPKQCKLIWVDARNSDLHANFELSRKGEEIGLFSPDGAMLDSVKYPELFPDISWGRSQDYPSQWVYFSEPTPDAVNDTPGVREPNVSSTPTFSLPAGFYPEKQILELSSTSASADILFTTDGSIPNLLSLEYRQPLSIDKTTVVRARIYEEGSLPSPVVTQTYFINERFTLPVVSLSANPEYFWDDWIGIYAEGKNGIIGNCLSSPYNFNQDWERPIHVEFYENSGNLGFQLDGGVKITGSCSRSYPQKSLAIFARTKYGENEIPYPLFPDKPCKKYKDFILRNGGNDWIRTLFSDAMMQYLVKDRMDIDYQAYRPSIVFLNGEYRGILNLREKLNEHYLEDNHGVDPDQVDIMETSAQEGDQVVVAGDDTHFQTMLSFLQKNDLSSDSAYATVQQMMDVNEFMNYLIAKIYYSSVDWPHNNVKFWRPKTEGGCWRWILFDNESGFGIWWSVSDSTLDSALRSGSTVSQLFSKLVKNTNFKNEFIQRFAAHINSTFKPDRVAKHIDGMQAVLEPEMPRQIDRWGKSGASGWGYSIYRSMSDWKSQIQLMRDFGIQRPTIMRIQIKNTFRLTGFYPLTLQTEPASAGAVYVNSVKMPEGQTVGEYYKNIPISLNAVANAGYKFIGWQGAPQNSEIENPLNRVFSEPAALTALFEKVESNVLAINEIHYHPSNAQGDDERYEFIEIVNAGESPADLSGYSIAGAAQFTFPQGAQLEPHAYLVFAKDSKTYEGNGYPVYAWSLGNLANSGETIQLLDANKNLIDAVSYEDQLPWPIEPDGEGPSLALLEPNLDNSLPQNWSFSAEQGGTPGKINFPNTGIDDWRIHE